MTTQFQEFYTPEAKYISYAESPSYFVEKIQQQIPQQEQQQQHNTEKVQYVEKSNPCIINLKPICIEQEPVAAKAGPLTIQQPPFIVKPDALTVPQPPLMLNLEPIILQQPPLTINSGPIQVKPPPMLVQPPEVMVNRPSFSIQPQILYDPKGALCKTGQGCAEHVHLRVGRAGETLGQKRNQGFVAQQSTPVRFQFQQTSQLPPMSAVPPLMPAPQLIPQQQQQLQQQQFQCGQCQSISHSQTPVAQTPPPAPELQWNYAPSRQRFRLQPIQEPVASSTVFTGAYRPGFAARSA